MRLRRSSSRPLSCYAAAQRPRATGLGEVPEREVPATTGRSPRAAFPPMKSARQRRYTRPMSTKPIVVAVAVATCLLCGCAATGNRSKLA